MYSFSLVQSMTFSNNNIVDALMMIQMILKQIINGSNIVWSLGFLIKSTVVATCTSSHQKIIIQVITKPTIMNNGLCVRFGILSPLLINQVYYSY